MANEPTDPRDNRDPADREPEKRLQHHLPDDEISLYDLWAVLERRWHILVGVALVVILLGLVYALTRETTHEYRSAIEIGTLETQDGEEELIEAPGNVRARLVNAIIPSVQARMAENFQDVPDVDVSGGDGEDASNVIVLTSTAPPPRSDVVNKLHSRVLDQLTAAHDELIGSRREALKRERSSLEAELGLLQDERMIEARRGQRRRAIAAARDAIETLKTQRDEKTLTLKAEIGTLQRRIDALKAQEGRTRGQLTRLDERKEVLTERLASARTILADLRQTRTGLVDTETKDSMLGLFLGSAEVASAQKRVDRLVDELKFGLPERRDELEAKVQDLADKRAAAKDKLEQKRTALDELEATYTRNIAEKRRIIDKEQSQLDRMKAEHGNKLAEKEREIEAVTSRIQQLAPTRISFESLKSLQPVGTSNKLILALAVVLGGMLSVFSAFLWEFISNARRYSKNARL